MLPVSRPPPTSRYHSFEPDRYTAADPNPLLDYYSSRRQPSHSVVVDQDQGTCSLEEVLWLAFKCNERVLSIEASPVHAHHLVLVVRASDYRAPFRACFSRDAVCRHWEDILALASNPDQLAAQVYGLGEPTLALRYWWQHMEDAGVRAPHLLYSDFFRERVRDFVHAQLLAGTPLPVAMVCLIEGLLHSEKNSI